MVICIVTLITFSILGIFSVRYRKLAIESFKCVSRMITFRPCETKLDEKIKSKLTTKLMKRSPALAKFFYKNFKFLSWIFTISFFASLIYSGYGIYNLLVYGNCSPGSGNACVINQLSLIFVCYEKEIVSGIIIFTIIATMFFLFKRYKFKIE